MKIKLSEIVNSTNRIKELLEIKMPIKVSYRINRIVDKLQPILATYDKKRNELVTEYGEKQENDTIQVTDPEKMKVFIEKITEILEVEEEVDFEKIPVDSLGDVMIEPSKLINFIFE